MAMRDGEVHLVSDGRNGLCRPAVLHGFDTIMVEEVALDLNGAAARTRAAE
ncbi:hypothetical protein G5V57_11785 [Nordella sp. HKS 07]|uniref:hypothetical protein n=1 Tax=Nordella sp. HKS 07 TaxID=2712222 RepID=UPI0013E1E5D5|nr:hypothetical protein [Nordella sp. HKS 07]QIG48345.1 hypothetical protein G5V57_11785 [Nordella sp. HKS 07]